MRTGMFRRAVAGFVAMLALVATISVPRADSASRVVGGTDAPAGSWPSLAALVTAGQTPSDRQFCGGTLVDPVWVVTAAHCVTNSTGTEVAAASFNVVLGVTDLAADTGQTHAISRIERHMGYVDGQFVNDVALLQLTTPAVLSSTVGVMDLVSPLRSDLWDAGSAAEVAGWGNTSSTGSAFVNGLQEASVEVIADSTCNSLMVDGTAPDFSATSMLCAGVLAGGTDTCQGDSGGPLAVKDGLVRTLAGLTSWGIGCAEPNKPGVYTRLDAYRDFVFGPTGLNLAAPGTPTGAGAVAGVQSATVSWTPPASDGGRAIQTYGVSVIRNGVAESLVPVDGGATQTTITGLSPGDPYTFTVTAANAVGLGATSPQTGAVVPTAPPPPVNTVAPAVGGDARRGSVLTATVGSWSFLGTAALAWERCDATGASCQDVAGATASTLELTAADVGARLRVRVVAANAAGTTTARSELSAAVVPPAPVVISGPAIAGIARAGRALHAGAGSWSESPDVQLVWQSCDVSGASCADIAGAAGATFTPSRAQIGRRIRVRAAAANAGGVGQATSQATSVVRGRFAIGVMRAQRVRQTSVGRLTVTIRVRVEPGARLAMRVLDRRGVARRLKRLNSRVNGRVPAGRGATMLTSIAPRSGVVDVTVVLDGARSGARRAARIALTATDAAGERAALVRAFRARL